MHSPFIAIFLDIKRDDDLLFRYRDVLFCEESSSSSSFYPKLQSQFKDTIEYKAKWSHRQQNNILYIFDDITMSLYMINHLRFILPLNGIIDIVLFIPIGIYQQFVR
jgi:hypothetical protein